MSTAKAGSKNKRKKNTPALPATPRLLNVATVFPTYVGQKNYEDSSALNDKLRLSIYKNKSENPEGIMRSNTGGTWHSDTNLLNWIGVPELADRFLESFLQYAFAFGADTTHELSFKLNAWAMVYNDRGYAMAHTHPNCHFAAVYYLDGAQEDETTMVTGIRTHPGDIEFVDTRNANAFFPGTLNGQTSYRLHPVAGDMLVFPSWLPHYVHPLSGKDDRICISCNGTIVKHTKDITK